jgi:OFA family oxalate/formate antiporter-like MFS transporter
MQIFRFVGFIFGSLIFICAMMITNPANVHNDKIAATIKYSQVFGQKRFYILAGATGLGTFSGLMFLGNLKPIALFLGYDSFVALMAIWIVSMSNALGRMAGGVAYDRFKAMSIKTILIAITIISLLLLAAGIDKIIFLLMFITVGLSYGWLISNIPAQVSEEYGHENFGMIFPMIFIGHGMTALFAAPLAGFIYDKYHTYRPAMILAAGIAFMCFTVFTLAYPKRNFQKELLVD